MARAYLRARSLCEACSTAELKIGAHGVVYYNVRQRAAVSRCTPGILWSAALRCWMDSEQQTFGAVRSSSDAAFLLVDMACCSI